MSALISAAELAGLLPQVCVLDVRWRLGRAWHEAGLASYESGHVPGAAYVDLEADLADPPGDPVDDRGRHPLPDPQRFGAAMRAHGVRSDRPVVVYDDWAGLAACRAWWLLRYHGHPDVRVLDGGWPAWRDGGADDSADRWADGRAPVETGSAPPGRVPSPDQPGFFVPRPGGLRLVDADAAAEVARTGVLLDARDPERFAGRAEPVDPVAGHVPGARNVPATANVEDGRFRPLRELARLHAGTGATGPIAVYCGSGVTAAHHVFALHLLGRDAALFAGSWSGWLADPRRPVATGRGGCGTP